MLDKLRSKLNITIEAAAFLGDDLNDLAVRLATGLLLTTS